MKNKTKMKQNGFTLVETLIYLGIIGSVMTSFLYFGVSIFDYRNKSYAVQEVQANERMALNLISQKIRGAKDINIYSSNSFATSTWDFDLPADYAYDSQKIELVSSKAQLAIIPTSISGGTTNSGFDTTVNPWAYSDWESTGASGARSTSGGNPGPYINIRIPFVRNNTSSGYWQQAFTTTVDNPNVATVSFDWRITSYSISRLISYDIYVFVDNTAGAPTLGTEVWSQHITGVTSWATVANIDVASKLTTAGTYYLKVVARRMTSNSSGSGTNTAGFDNIQLNWSGNGISFSTDNPAINPVSPASLSGVLSWSGFAETATKNGGEIYYQLSNDSGLTWQYWNGSSWIAAGAADYNTASVVSTNIGQFSTSSADIMFKAFLASDGTQQVELDKVHIGYFGNSGSGYETKFGADPGVLSLVMDDVNKNPTIINLNQDDGSLQITEGAGTAMAVTSKKVKVKNLVFTDLSLASSTKNIKINMTIDYNNVNQDVKYNYSDDLETAVSFRR